MEKVIKAKTRLDIILFWISSLIIHKAAGTLCYIITLEYWSFCIFHISLIRLMKGTKSKNVNVLDNIFEPHM